MPEYKVKITIEVIAYVHAESEEDAENNIYADEFGDYLMNGHDIINVNAEHHRD